jgi:nucleoside-diphosphate-sugar epimerase
VLALPGEDTTRLEQRAVQVHRGDVRHYETLREPMRGAEGVMHLAGLMGVWRPLAAYRAVNVAGTENVCRAALAEGVRRFVHVSSWTVYGIGVPTPVREDFVLRPFGDPYAITKAEGDLVVQRMVVDEHLPAVIIRPGTFFGEGDRLHFGRIADRLQIGRGVIIGSGENRLPFVYVTDVVQGLLLALDHEHAVGQAYNITNDRPLSQRGLFDAIARAIGVSPPRRHIPYPPLYAAAWLAERAALLARSARQPPLTRLGVKLFGTDNRHAIEKARRELGYQPAVSLEDGVLLAAAWYRTQVGPCASVSRPQRLRARHAMPHLRA